MDISQDLSIKDKFKAKVTTGVLSFLRDNVIGVTELTRENRLNEILNQYSVGISTDVYIIQNHKKKNALAVLSDLDFFEQLLKYKEAVEDSIDNYMFKIALERQDDEANIPLTAVLEGEDFNVEDIINRASELEIED